MQATKKSIPHKKRKEFLSFREARAFARKLGLKSVKEWGHYWATHRPQGIPSKPQNTYKNDGWISYIDFLGLKKKEFVPFEEAQQIARTHDIKSRKHWRVFVKENPRHRIPRNPERVYRPHGWTNWDDFLR